MKTRRQKALAVLLAPLATVSCRRAPAPQVTAEDAGMRPVTGIATPEVRASASAARPGMVYVPAGTLRAGTPAGNVPRVADEEMAGTPVPMQGFYIDQLPYPNEPGAIPTTNVTRDEAALLCAAKGKRLCTELEWERACKGEANTTYEYGDVYRPQTCGTGATAEEGARRPSGESAACKSSFGVADLHGGVWQWTSSTWGRGSSDGKLGVLRGGNAVAGELVGRCANAIGRPAAKKSATMGLRCCAGAKNEAEVQVSFRGSPGIVLQAKPDAIAAALPDTIADGATASRAYRWSPVANESLGIVLTCARNGAPCSFVVGRMPDAEAADAGAAASPTVIAREAMGLVVPDLARLGDAKHLRLRGIDTNGTFSREVTYVYGRIDVGPMKRP